MPDLLTRMAASSARRAAALAPAAELRARCADAPPALALRLSAERFDLVAEVKRRAPSAGVLADAAGGPDDAVRRATAYAAAGAAAISVLTEPDEFLGALEDLAAAAAALPGVPVMRKDFLLDPRQLLEARAAGASGALLIVRMLDDAALDAMLETAAACGLWLLLEAFDEDDLTRIDRLPRGPQLLAGVNARDLASLAIDATRCARLAVHLPRGMAAVAESGMATAADAAAAATAGYALALVGSALMRAADPGDLVRAMLAAGRSCRA